MWILLGAAPTTRRGTHNGNPLDPAHDLLVAEFVNRNVTGHVPNLQVKNSLTRPDGPREGEGPTSLKVRRAEAAPTSARCH
jgi:hypothetical protein